MEVGEKYRLLFPTEYGNFNQNDEVVVTNVINFPATGTMFYTLQNVKNIDHVATFKFVSYSDLVLLS